VSATEATRIGKGQSSAPTAQLLRVRRLNVSLGRGHGVPILHDVDLDVAAGEIVGLIGETGSGKTTLARAILGLVPLRSGAVSLGDTPLSALRESKLRAFRRTGQIQYVFQDPLRSLDPDLQVRDIVGEGLAVRGVSGPERADLVRAALEQVGLDPALVDRTPGQISGGQRQRVAIARALVMRPRLLICDEPVSALDVSNRNHILRLLADLRDELGVGIIVISHDLGALASITDSIAVLYHGRLVEYGSTKDVFTAPRHSYTRLLIASVPSINAAASIDAERRRELRDQVARETGMVE
jgi:ABC-type microcin C transport system duplicated ATPase subunit YejF